MNLMRARTPLVSTLISIVAAIELALMALYAALNPQPVPIIPMGKLGLDAPDPNVLAASQGAVMWPALLAVLAIVAAFAVLRWPDRFTYLFAGAIGVVMVGIALTLPAWLSALAPLSVLLGITGIAAVLVAVVGWLPSAPLPESLPGWPEHHGGI